MLQAIISGTFSIIRQSLMLGCFPRVKIVHTSGLVEGQIYIPEANWIMMVLTIIVVAGFRDQDAISNAYGALASRHVLGRTKAAMYRRMPWRQIAIWS